LNSSGKSSGTLLTPEGTQKERKAKWESGPSLEIGSWPEIILPKKYEKSSGGLLAEGEYPPLDLVRQHGTKTVQKKNRRGGLKCARIKKESEKRREMRWN